MPPQCRLFVENALCCGDDGLFVNRPYLSVDVFCSVSVSMNVSCLSVEGPSNVTVTNNVIPNIASSVAYRFSASWIADASYTGAVLLSINRTVCPLEIDACESVAQAANATAESSLAGRTNATSLDDGGTSDEDAAADAQLADAPAADAPSPLPSTTGTTTTTTTRTTTETTTTEKTTTTTTTTETTTTETAEASTSSVAEATTPSPSPSASSSVAQATAPSPSPSASNSTSNSTSASSASGSEVYASVVAVRSISVTAVAQSDWSSMIPLTDETVEGYALQGYDSLSWDLNNGTGGCAQLPMALVPATFFQQAAYINYQVGIASTCLGDASEITAQT